MKYSTKLTRRVAFTAVTLMLPALNFAAYAQSSATNAYAQSLYGYCDAKKVASVWKSGVGEAKTIIGNKILGNLQNLIDADIASTRTRVTCSWDDTGLSFDDAMRLARFWGNDSIQAKQKAVELTTEMGNKKFMSLMSNVLMRS